MSVLASLLTFALFAGRSFAKTAAEWSELSIYQVITDRFATTDGSIPTCGLHDYCGGTWQGLESKLDYIQGMGFDAVWISPITHNIEGETFSGEAYMGFWPDDPFSLNDHFGTSDDLQSLSSALHSRGMSLMVDVVINDLAANADGDAVDYSQFPSPFNTASAFHPACPTDYSSQTSIENCWLVDTPPPSLADLNTEDPTVLSSMIQSVVSLIQTYNIDGIRLDAAEHIPKPALSQFQSAVGVFVTGEADNGGIGYVSGYQGPLNSAENYPLYFSTISTFTTPSTFSSLSSTISSTETTFSDPNSLTNFLDNQDQPRLANYTGDDVVRDANAATFLFLTTGIPIIYYGFEQRFSGGTDPYNREMMWSSNYDTTTPLYTYITKLHQIRSLAAASNGTSTFFADTHAIVVGSSESYMAMERGPLLVVVGNSGAAGAGGYEVPDSQFGNGVAIVDLIACGTTTTGSGGSFFAANEGGQASIWVTADFDNGGLC